MSSNPPTDRAAAGPPAAPAASRGWLPRSLATRLTLTTIALVAVVSVFVAVVTTIALRGFLLDKLDEELLQNAEFSARAMMQRGGMMDQGVEDGRCDVDGAMMGRFLVPGGPGSLTGVLDDGCRRAVVVTEAASAVVVSTAGLDALDGLAPGDPATVDLDGAGTFRVVVTDFAGHRLVTGLPTSQVEATLGRLVGFEALVGLLGVVAAAVAASVLVRRELAPLREVAATAREVTALRLDEGAVGVTARVPPWLTDPETEVGQVGGALNRMLGHVESALDARHRSEQQVRQFVADASHELRTPLSTIQGYAELAARPDGGGVGLSDAMAKVQVESARMADLVDDLLLLARLDAGRPLERSDVDLTRLVVETVDDARVVGSDHQWRLALPDDPVVVVGDERRLHQVLANLVGNARRHTGPGTIVTVSAWVDGATARVAVRDNGPGIPPALRGREFERFTRGDGSRARASGGSGLGLSIVKAIVDAHGGAVRVRSGADGTVVELRLPRAGR